MTLQGHRAQLSQSDHDDFIEKIVRNSTRLHSLIEGVLAASRWDAVQREDATKLDILAAIREVIDQMRDVAADRPILVDVAEALPSVRAAAQRVDLIIRNLVENAVKYSPAGSPIAIRARASNGEVTIEVTDRGPGIAPEHRDRVFERFVQLDQTSTRRVGGTGLGLYLVKTLAEAVGGRVELDSEVDRGSTFKVTFPAETGVIPFPTRVKRAQ
jgi:signal transduction histidine kinase